jgi:hypothetical protein
MFAQSGKIFRESSQKLRNNLLDRSGIVSLCKENVGMVEQKNVKTVLKSNVLQARTIENFWALLN